MILVAIVVQRERTIRQRHACVAYSRVADPRGDARKDTPQYQVASYGGSSGRRGGEGKGGE